IACRARPSTAADTWKYWACSHSRPRRWVDTAARLQAKSGAGASYVRVHCPAGCQITACAELLSAPACTRLTNSGGRQTAAIVTPATCTESEWPYSRTNVTLRLTRKLLILPF